MKLISLFISFCLIFEQAAFAQFAAQLDIAGHLNALRSSFVQDKFRPLHLRYISYDNLNNNFKLLLDKGDLKNPKTTELEDVSKDLLKYFFIGIALPNDSFWVNLRPDAEDNIIDGYLAQTDIGKIMLEADLQLKKDTAKATSPETPEGKEYWDKLYKKTGEIFGYDNVTIPTLTRPWIVPDEIIIRESAESAYVYKAMLKVMLEQDYLKNSAVYNFQDNRLKELNEYSSQLIRELIIPKLTKEINTSKRYAPLRQVYYSLILAQWFKARYANKDTAYSRLINRKDLTHLASKESWSKTTYFKEYQKSFKDGEYNISESVYTPYGQTIRSYFSGGISSFMSQPQVEQELTMPIGAAGNKAVLPAATPVSDSPVLSGYLLRGVSNTAGQVNIFAQTLESEKDFGATIGRWKYTSITFSTDGRLILHNATRIPMKDGLVEEEFLIGGQNKPRDIILQTRPLNSAEQEKISIIKQELRIRYKPRVIVRDESAIKNRIYGIAAQGIIFIREDIISDGNRDQIKEALDHENRELTVQSHDNIRREQYRGDLRTLITRLSEQDKIGRKISGKEDSAVVSVSRNYAYPAGNVDIRVSDPNNNYYQTSEGSISIGMTMGYRSLFPDASNYPRIIIAPRGEWRGRDGENIMQLYFAIAANFAFHKRKTIVVCRSGQKQRIIRYLELGNPYYLPNIANYSEELIDRFRREAIYLADRMVVAGKTQMATPYPDMVEFVEFSDKGAASIGGVVIKDQADGTYIVSDSVRPQEKVLDGRNMSELTVDLNGVESLSEIPELGVTFLGTSSVVSLTLLYI